MVISSRNSVKVKAKKYLEQQLVLLRPGEALPPIRALVRESGVGRMRLNSLLEEFESQGVIVRRPGCGIYKVGDGDDVQLIPFIDLVACGRTNDIRLEGSYFADLITIFSSEVTRTHQGIRLHQVRFDDPISDYEMILRRSDVRACVLLTQHTPELAEIFDRHNVAWVSLHPQFGHGLRRAILPPQNVTDMQLRHLWDLGHQRVAYLHGISDKSPSWTLLLQREAYYRLMAERGYQVEPHWVAFTTYQDKDIYTAWEQVFSKPPYPTAAIIPDAILSTSYRFLEQRGLKVGKDISIIVRDDLPVASTVHPAATSVRMAREDVVRTTMKALQQVLAGEELPDIQYLDADFVVRESTGPAPEA